MNIIEWLQNGDESISRLTKKYLLGETPTYAYSGWISAYLELFDEKTNMWSNAIYSPKWTSTFYTLRELIILEADPNDARMQKAYQTLLKHMWLEHHKINGCGCMIAMLLSMGIYLQQDQKLIDELLKFIIDHQIFDGGFNCEVTRREVKSSSIHTTISTLEALNALTKSKYKYDQIKVNKIIDEAEDFLLRKNLLRRERDGRLIQSFIKEIHYPTRWKYDYLRALVYFAKKEKPYDSRMEEGLTLLKSKFKRGTLPKGSSYQGLIHFELDNQDVKRMNTLNGLIVLKYYDDKLYQKITGEVYENI